MNALECICSDLGKTNILNQQNIAKNSREPKYNPKPTNQTQYKHNYFKMY